MPCTKSIYVPGRFLVEGDALSRSSFRSVPTENDRILENEGKVFAVGVKNFNITEPKLQKIIVEQNRDKVIDKVIDYTLNMVGRKETLMKKLKIITQQG